jgi:hypothetical protein
VNGVTYLPKNSRYWRGITVKNNRYWRGIYCQEQPLLARYYCQEQPLLARYLLSRTTVTGEVFTVKNTTSNLLREGPE